MASDHLLLIATWPSCIWSCKIEVSSEACELRTPFGDLHDSTALRTAALCQTNMSHVNDQVINSLRARHHEELVHILHHPLTWSNPDRDPVDPCSAAEHGFEDSCELRVHLNICLPQVRKLPWTVQLLSCQLTRQAPAWRSWLHSCRELQPGAVSRCYWRPLLKPCETLLPWTSSYAAAERSVAPYAHLNTDADCMGEWKFITADTAV